MDLQKELVRWARGLPKWQQHLVALLSAKSELRADEEEVAYVALLAAHGSGSRPEDLESVAAHHFAGPTRLRKAARLYSLGHFRGVNAVVPGQRLEFETEGLTVIYGDNAAGKTGYTRPLKHLGRAVARDDGVLPNVFDKKPARSTVKVEVQEGGAVRGFEVDLNAAAPSDLASLSVFDTDCADNYVAQSNTIAFTPEPLLIFDRLVQAQMTLRGRLDERVQAIKATEPALPEFAPDTRVRSALDSLATTSVADLRALAGLTDPEELRRAELHERVASAEAGTSHVRAAAAERDGDAAHRLGQALGALEELVGAAGLARFAELERRARQTAEAALAARKQAFSGLSVAGVGSEAWRLLWDAARRFFEHEVAPDRTFPPADHGDRCPLCLQELDAEALDRFARFQAFIRSATSADADRAREELEAARAKLSEDVVERCRSDFVDGLGPTEPGLHRSIYSFVDIRARRLRATRVGGPIGGDGDEDADPRGELAKLEARYRRNARELRELEGGDQADVLRSELRELSARRLLAERMEDAITWKESLAELDRIAVARRALDTGAITRKQRELSDQVITHVLTDRLRNELRSLQLGHVRVEPAVKGQRGTTVVRLRLGAGAASHPLPSVLSDGEQRALALAFFLAEVGAAGHDGGAVLDDPVSSLDQSRRTVVAERLVVEAGERQVVVFTHDIAFMFHLTRVADRDSVPLRIQTVWRSGDGVGRTSPEAPWPAMSATKRIKRLRDQLQNMSDEAELGPEDYRAAVKQWYESLRETWERAVEQELLNGVVERFHPDVKTKSLHEVRLTSARIAQVEAGMARCSTFTHDSPLADAPALPSKTDMRVDLEELDDFVKAVRKDRKSG
jgi:recombinational DNA repair ATPase RecF